MIKYIFRKEAFGSVLYNRNTLKYEFLSERDLENVLNVLKKNNQIYEYWDITKKDHRDDILSSPIRIYFEITLKCNMNCKLCFNESGQPREYELTTAQIMATLEKLKSARVIDLRFTGGEITQHPDWYEILKGAKNLGFVVSCNTNGMFDRSVADKLVSLSLDQITLSIDGIDDAHDQNRGRGSYARVYETLRTLSEANVHVRINTLITKSSLNQVESLIELAGRYSEEINFFPFRFLGRAGSEINKSVLMEDYKQMAKKAFNEQKKYPKLRVLHFAQSYHSRSIDNDGYLGLRMGGPDGFTCLNITSDGKYWAGGYTPYIDPGAYLGNVIDHDLIDIWQNSKKLEVFREKSHRLKSLCSKCYLFLEKCPGAMYEMEYIRMKNPEMKNPFCIYGEGPSLLKII